MINNMDSSWSYILRSEFSKPYFINLIDFIKDERKNKCIYPPDELLFSSLKLTSFNDVKVVILGQDPYCNVGQANGLAFSVPLNFSLPPTLINIYKELFNDLGIKNSFNGDLSKWARQGVLLINSILTVEAKKPGSHFNIGWEFFTNRIIEILSESGRNIIFVLWGKSAIEKMDFISYEKNIVFTSSHPSPVSSDKGFFGSRPFSRINFNLRFLMKSEIDWRIY